MNRRIALALAALVLAAAVLACWPFAPTPTQPPSVDNDNDGSGETTDAPGSNTETVNGSDGISSMPVNCGNAYGDVYMPENSFDGEETFTISCIDNNEAQDLDALVKQETNETGNVLGAISFEPSPFDFDKDVTITIPLLYPRPDLAGQDHDLYYYNEVSNTLEYVKKARIDDYGLTASASVNHFSTFILVGPPEGGIAEPEPVFVCSDPLGCLDLAPGEPIRIAALLDFESSAGEASKLIFEAVQSAAADYGGIGDHPFEIVPLDSACDAKLGEARAYQILEEGNYAGVIGTVCSASVESSIPILSDAGLTVISPANTRTSLTLPGTRQPGYFRVSMTNVPEAQAAADFMYYELDIDSVGIYYATGIYGQEMAEIFASRFMELGGSIVDTNEVPSGTTDMNPYMDSLIGSYADAVYLPLLSAEGIYFVQYMGEYDLGIPAVGASSLAEPSFFDGAGYYPYGVYYVGPPSSYYDFGYDAAILLIEALNRVAYVEDNGTLHIGRQGLRDALYSISFEGKTGFISCNEFGDCGHAGIPVYVISGGERKEVYLYRP